jgi:hypothetical protein
MNQACPARWRAAGLDSTRTDDAVESLTSALFIGQIYPFGASGLYLKGGAGLGVNAVDFPDGISRR